MARLLSLLWHDVYSRDTAESGFRGSAADRYKLTESQFDAHIEALSQVCSQPPVLVSEPLTGARGCTPVAITVDDGGLSYYTVVAERLEARGWRGHCFVTTGQIGRRGFLDRSQIRALHRRGHLIGTHSVSHPDRFASRPWAQLIREWADSRKALEDILGAPVFVGSVPGGHYLPRVAKAASHAGLKMLFTSEPETRLRLAGGLVTAGRFAIRRGSTPEFIRRLGGMKRATLWREWAAWNAKKTLKRFLGPAYSGVTALAGRAIETR